MCINPTELHRRAPCVPLTEHLNNVRNCVDGLDSGFVMAHRHTRTHTHTDFYIVCTLSYGLPSCPHILQTAAMVFSSSTQRLVVAYSLCARCASLPLCLPSNFILRALARFACTASLYFCACVFVFCLNGGFAAKPYVYQHKPTHSRLHTVARGRHARIFALTFTGAGWMDGWQDG